MKKKPKVIIAFFFFERFQLKDFLIEFFLKMVPFCQFLSYENTLNIARSSVYRNISILGSSKAAGQSWVSKRILRSKENQYDVLIDAYKNLLPAKMVQR